MATNRADTLDPALLRPGRLDRKIEFPLPDRRQKRLIFQVWASVGGQGGNGTPKPPEPSWGGRLGGKLMRQQGHRIFLPGAEGRKGGRGCCSFSLFSRTTAPPILPVSPYFVHTSTVPRCAPAR